MNRNNFRGLRSWGKASLALAAAFTLSLSSCKNEEPAGRDNTELVKQYPETSFVLDLDATLSTALRGFAFNTDNGLKLDVNTPVENFAAEVYLRKDGDQNVYKLKNKLTWTAVQEDTAGDQLKLVLDSKQTSGQVTVVNLTNATVPPQPAEGDTWYLAALIGTAQNGASATQQKLAFAGDAPVIERGDVSAIFSSGWVKLKAGANSLSGVLAFKPEGAIVKVKVTNKVAQQMDSSQPVVIGTNLVGTDGYFDLSVAPTAQNTDLTWKWNQGKASGVEMYNLYLDLAEGASAEYVVWGVRKNVDPEVNKQYAFVSNAQMLLRPEGATGTNLPPYANFNLSGANLERFAKGNYTSLSVETVREREQQTKAPLEGKFFLTYGEQDAKWRLMPGFASQTPQVIYWKGTQVHPNNEYYPATMWDSWENKTYGNGFYIGLYRHDEIKEKFMGDAFRNNGFPPLLYASSVEQATGYQRRMDVVDANNELMSLADWNTLLPIGYEGTQGAANSANALVFNESMNRTGVKDYYDAAAGVVTSDYLYVPSVVDERTGQARKVVYAIRFRGGSNEELRAFKYEIFESYPGQAPPMKPLGAMIDPMREEDNNGIKITARYLGPDFAGLPVSALKDPNFWKASGKYIRGKNEWFHQDEFSYLKDTNTKSHLQTLILPFYYRDSRGASRKMPVLDTGRIWGTWFQESIAWMRYLNSHQGQNFWAKNIYQKDYYEMKDATYGKRSVYWSRDGVENQNRSWGVIISNDAQSPDGVGVHAQQFPRADATAGIVMYKYIQRTGVIRNPG